MNKENLRKLADYLIQIPQEGFGMQDFCTDSKGEDVKPPYWECGTVACAVGHGPRAGLAVRNDDSCWLTYGVRVFGLWPFESDGKWVQAENPAWVWCFSGAWKSKDNTPAGAAKRIYWLLEHGVPEDWAAQMRGEAKLCYEQEQGRVHKQAEQEEQEQEVLDAERELCDA